MLTSTSAAPAVVYDPILQINILPDGTPVIDSGEAFGTTTSTAGSKVHFDD
jgi:putative ATP-grasp target RiPP